MSPLLGGELHVQAGRIGGAGLDVYEFEPKVPQALIDEIAKMHLVVLGRIQLGDPR